MLETGLIQRESDIKMALASLKMFSPGHSLGRANCPLPLDNSLSITDQVFSLCGLKTKHNGVVGRGRGSLCYIPPLPDKRY